MTFDHEPQHRPWMDLEDDVLQRLDNIDESLLERLERDERYQSGVPQNQRTSDIDFVQMTGLTRPLADAAAKSRPDRTPKQPEATRPVSFYEKGVDDVGQQEMGKQSSVGDEELRADKRSAGKTERPGEATVLDASSIINLKDILDELESRGAETPVPEDLDAVSEMGESQEEVVASPECAVADSVIVEEPASQTEPASDTALGDSGVEASPAETPATELDSEPVLELQETVSSQVESVEDRPKISLVRGAAKPSDDGAFEWALLLEEKDLAQPHGEVSEAAEAPSSATDTFSHIIEVVPPKVHVDNTVDWEAAKEPEPLQTEGEPETVTAPFEEVFEPLPEPPPEILPKRIDLTAEVSTQKVEPEPEPEVIVDWQPSIEEAAVPSDANAADRDVEAAGTGSYSDFFEPIPASIPVPPREIIVESTRVEETQEAATEEPALEEVLQPDISVDEVSQFAASSDELLSEIAPEEAFPEGVATEPIVQTAKDQTETSSEDMVIEVAVGEPAPDAAPELQAFDEEHPPAMAPLEETVLKPVGGEISLEEIVPPELHSAGQFAEEAVSEVIVEEAEPEGAEEPSGAPTDSTSEEEQVEIPSDVSSTFDEQEWATWLNRFVNKPESDMAAEKATAAAKGVPPVEREMEEWFAATPEAGDDVVEPELIRDEPVASDVSEGMAASQSFVDAFEYPVPMSDDAGVSQPREVGVLDTDSERVQKDAIAEVEAVWASEQSRQPETREVQVEDVTASVEIPEDEIVPSSERREGLVGATSPPEMVPLPVGAAEGPSTLAEAERLVQELESQPRDIPWDTAPPTVEAVGEFAGALLDPASAGGDPQEVIYRETRKTQGRRRSKRSKRRWSRHVIRWLIAATALVVIAVGVYAGYQWLKPRFATPESAFAMAESLARQQHFAEASNAFADFARLHPEHPAHAEAQFEAAHYLLLAPTSSFDEETGNRKEALTLFEAFVKDNPAHVKAARATTLIGQINFLLGNHEKAIDVLRDPALRLRDPESALPSLRTLARSYTQLGDYAAAESLYLQAASLAGNISADVDYVELADLYELQASRAQTEEERERLGKSAVEYWTKATRIPGIDPANRAKIQAKRDWFLGHGNESEGALETPSDTTATTGIPAQQPAVDAKPSSNAAPVPPTSQVAPVLPPAAPQASAGTVTSPETNTETTPSGPNPDLEAQFLGNGAAAIPPSVPESANAQ